MKITFIRNLNPFYESTAPANRYEGLLRGLVELGVEVTLIITDGFGSKKEYDDYKNKCTNNACKVHYLFSAFYDNIWLRRLNIYLLAYPKKVIVGRRLKKIVSNGYDFIWLSYQNNVLEYYLKYNLSQKAPVLIELNEFNDLHEGHVNFRNKYHKYLAIKENKVFKQALCKIDLIAVMTQTLMTHYKQMASEKAQFLHLPMTVDLDRFVNKSDFTACVKPYIAYTGTFDNLKDGVEILIRAFIKVAAQYPDYKLYLTGFFHHDIYIQKQLIEDAKLRDRIIYIDQLNKTEVPLFVQNAELLVLARPDSRQARGGFPTKLGEYLASGVPVCVTRVGEIPDYLIDSESAYLAEPGNVDSFADAINRALSDRELMTKVGENGLKVAQTVFNSKIQAKHLYEFLIQNCR